MENNREGSWGAGTNVLAKYPHLQNRNKYYCYELEIINMKHLAQCLTHGFGKEQILYAWH